jgi:hypothetical protein
MRAQAGFEVTLGQQVIELPQWSAQLHQRKCKRHTDRFRAPAASSYVIIVTIYGQVNIVGIPFVRR